MKTLRSMETKLILMPKIKLFNTFSPRKHPRKHSRIQKRIKCSLFNIITFQNNVLSFTEDIPFPFIHWKSNKLHQGKCKTHNQSPVSIPYFLSTKDNFCTEIKIQNSTFYIYKPTTSNQ